MFTYFQMSQRRNLLDNVKLNMSKQFFKFVVPANTCEAELCRPRHSKSDRSLTEQTKHGNVESNIDAPQWAPERIDA